MQTKSLLVTFMLALCRSSSCGTELSRKQATVNRLSRIYRKFYQESQNIKIIISGGTRADRKEYPWYAQLRRNGRDACSAIILNDRTILTAAHCIKYSCQGSENVEDWYKVVVGTHTSRRPSKRAQMAKVEKIIVHEKYNVHRFYEGHDIAILHLKKPVKLSSSTQPVRLSDSTFDEEALTNTNCYVSGIGAVKQDEYGFEYPEFLREKRVNIITNKECKQNTIVSRGIVCTKYSETTDVCPGDSGGPMGCYDSDGNFRLIGVTSGYSGQCGAYEPGLTAIYTRVSHYRKWLVANSLGDIDMQI